MKGKQDGEMGVPGVEGGIGKMEGHGGRNRQSA